MAENAAPFIVDYLLELHAQFAEEKPDSPLAGDFPGFARKFMDQHRPSTMQNVGGNFVIKLTNGDEVAVAPPLEGGGMQQSGRAIPVTGHETAREIVKAGGPMGPPESGPTGYRR